LKSRRHAKLLWSSSDSQSSLPIYNPPLQPSQGSRALPAGRGI
jgi:hypothetical protein